MKTLDQNDILNKLLAADDNTLLAQIQIEITSFTNPTRPQDALRAIELISKVLESKQNVHLYFYRGYNYRMLGEHKLALDDYSALKKLDDNFYGIYAMTASQHNQIGETEQAIQDYTIELSRGETYDVYFSRSECYFLLNKFDLARSDWEKAVPLKIESDRFIAEGRAKMWAEVERLEREELEKKK